MQGELTHNDIESFLKGQSIGRIACHAGGKSYLFPITYIYEEGNIYCYGHEGMKIRMMRENPQVCFEVDSVENSNEWKSVVAWGIFEEIKNEGLRTKLMETIIVRTMSFFGSKALQRELKENYPYLPDDTRTMKGIVFRLALKEKTGRFEVKESAANWMTD